MAVALLTTLYGAVLANCVFIPLADKLRLRAQEESSCKSLMLDGVLAIQQGLNPRLVESMLRAYLPEGQRKGESRPCILAMMTSPPRPYKGAALGNHLCGPYVPCSCVFVLLLAYSEMDAKKIR